MSLSNIYITITDNIVYYSSNFSWSPSINNRLIKIVKAVRGFLIDVI